MGGALLSISRRKAPSERMFLFSAIMGLFLYRAAAWAVFNTGFPSDALLGLDYIQGVARGAHVTALVAILIWHHIVRHGAGVPAGVFVACGGAMSLGAVLVSLGLTNGVASAALAGAVVHGAASSILFLGWGVLYCRLNPCKSTVMIAAAFLIYGIFTMIAQYAMPDILTMSSFVLPLACGVCLVFSNAAMGDECAEGGSSSLHDVLSARRLPWGVIALIAGCCLISGTVDVIAPYDRSSNIPLFNLLWPALFLIVFVAAFVWTQILKRRDTHGLWVLFAFLFFCCLIGFSSFYSIDQAMASEFVRATQELLMLFIWVFATEVIAEYKLPALVSFGCTGLLFIQGEHIAVSAIRSLSNHFHVQVNATAAIVFAFVVAVVLVATTLILLSRYSSAKQGEANSVSDGSDASLPDCRISFLRESFMLSERECEIAGYLLRGYSLQKIADALSLSLDTVRYHVKNLYKKTDVHNKQDLIQLAESLCGKK